MAVISNLVGTGLEEKTIYEGCVLNYYERNGYDDSDWYAECWDPEKKEIVTVCYNTTRCGCWGTAVIDVTEANLRECYRYQKQKAAKDFDEVFNAAQAKKIRKGDTVKVVRGRKVKKGTVGKVFWIGTAYNSFSYRNEERIGIEVNGERCFIPAEYAEVIGWEDRLLHGHARKMEIRRATLNRIPVPVRNNFEGVKRR